MDKVNLFNDIVLGILILFVLIMLYVVQPTNTMFISGIIGVMLGWSIFTLCIKLRSKKYNGS